MSKKLDEIKAMDKDYITPAIAATVCGMHEHTIRLIAHERPDDLTFPVLIGGPDGRLVRIPRIPFIKAFDPDWSPEDERFDRIEEKLGLILTALEVT